MKVAALVFGLLLFSSTVFAAPFLVSDPYSTGTVIEKFVVVINGTSYNSVPESVAGGSRLHFDLASIWVPGSNSLTVKAVNLWGESSAVPFSFVAGLPASPANVTLSAQ